MQQIPNKNSTVDYTVSLCISRCIFIKDINYVPFKRPLFGAVLLYFFVLSCFSKEQSKMNQKRSKKCEYQRWSPRRRPWPRGRPRGQILKSLALA